MQHMIKNFRTMFLFGHYDDHIWWSSRQRLSGDEHMYSHEKGGRS
jgi:hypothetical protein